MAVKRRKEFVGRVISDRMNKTVTVLVENLYRHPTYGKIVKRRMKFKAHDEDNKCHTGDKVKIIETRPISKDKHWAVIDILESSQAGE
ncbi:MAG: 30S ribosomal protein S17 [Nitrospirae bacterium]|nr:30S ribosomal protein S17 [Nitrospirota bacterium]